MKRTARATGDKTVSRRNFLRLGMGLAGVAAFGVHSATRSKYAVADSTTFPGIRWYPVIGVYNGANRGWASNRTLLQDQYDFWVGTGRENRYLDLGDGDAERYWFAGGQKIKWRDCLVDETLAPTSHAQARDPNWSNYQWNRQDIFTEMLAGSSAALQDKAKLGLFVAVTATSEKNAVPTWLLRDSRKLTWTDGQGQDHVRLDKDEGWRAVADLLVAMTQRYGLDKRVASLTIGEYWAPKGSGRPADFDYNLYRANAKKVWSDVTQNAPKDASGARMNIVQAEPITGGGFVTANDIANIGIGVSGSGARIFASDTLDGVRQQLYGAVPLQHQCNSGTIGDPVTFDGTPNPWAYAKGQTVAQRYEHVVWYYGSKGVAPLDSMYLGTYGSLHDQWVQAYDQFGPNGSLGAQWGQLANYP